MSQAEFVQWMGEAVDQRIRRERMLWIVAMVLLCAIMVTGYTAARHREYKVDRSTVELWDGIDSVRPEELR